MDLGQPLLTLVDVDGFGWTVVGTFNLWGPEISLDVNQPTFGSRSTVVGNGEYMLQHSTCQSFGTDWKELIAMIKEPHAWPSFVTELERIETLQICFSDFNIIHVTRARNQFSDFLAKSARSFRRELHFYWLFYSGLVTQTTSSLSNRMNF